MVTVGVVLLVVITDDATMRLCCRQHETRDGDVPHTFGSFQGVIEHERGPAELC